MPLYNESHMRTLIIQLPPGLPSPSLVYAHARLEAEPGSRPLALQWAAAALLPAADRQSETVVLVPAAALSWHRVELPAGLHKQAQRVQAALQGLLEDRLLDDPEHLHLALQADGAKHPRPWVAVCDRAWLSAHLNALEQAGLPVHRIVPELAPGTPGSPVQLTAVGDADTGWLWVSHPERGVWGQPWPALRQAGLAAHERLGLSEPEQATASLQAHWLGQGADTAPLRAIVYLVDHCRGNAANDSEPGFANRPIKERVVWMIELFERVEAQRQAQRGLQRLGG